MTTYVNIGSGGADTWAHSVATSGDLPSTGATGEIRLDRATGDIYYWNGSAWALIGADIAAGINVQDLTSITDGSTATAGLLTERITASQASATTTGVAASGSFGDVASISVTAGRWNITGVLGVDDNGATLTTAIEAAISASATGAGLGIIDVVKDDSVSGSTVSRSYRVPDVFASLSGTTTYYLNSKFTYSAGTPAHYGKISAIRIG